MRTVGVDLAAQPKHTAVAVIEWEPGRARVAEIELPADDDAVLRQSQRADKVGIDCPLGWPEPFVEFLCAHRLNAHQTPAGDPRREAWRSLAYRRTDERVRTVAGLVPLSVATDRIGLTAMRAARLQALLAHRGHDVQRSGTGLIVEVYPAAGLKLWRLPHNRYKGRAHHGGLGTLVDALVGAAPWLALAEHEEVCRRSDHAIDAVVAALLARATARGFTEMPKGADRTAAAVEGWIALPSCPVGDLVS
jgi:predicted nuclease with RNAse H fold